MLFTLKPDRLGNIIPKTRNYVKMDLFGLFCVTKRVIFIIWFVLRTLHVLFKRPIEIFVLTYVVNINYSDMKRNFRTTQQEINWKPFANYSKNLE